MNYFPGLSGTLLLLFFSLSMLKVKSNTEFGLCQKVPDVMHFSNSRSAFLKKENDATAVIWTAWKWKIIIIFHILTFTHFYLKKKAKSFLQTAGHYNVLEKITQTGVNSDVVGNYFQLLVYTSLASEDVQQVLLYVCLTINYSAVFNVCHHEAHFVILSLKTCNLCIRRLQFHPWHQNKTCLYHY